jgi:hypothetical protein
MTVGELKKLLDEHPSDQEVVILEQPAWPFEHAVAGVTSVDHINVELRNEDPPAQLETPTGLNGSDVPDQRVFIVAGRQLCYGHTEVFHHVEQ